MAENRILKIINTLFPEGRYKEVIQQLDGLKDIGLSSEEMEAWYYWRSHADFLSGNIDSALEIVKEGLDGLPGSGYINLGMAQGYEGLGQIKSALPYFNKVTIKNISPYRILFKSYFLYLWGFNASALESMSEIFNVYHQDRNLDTTHLWIAEVPFYDVAFGYLVTFSKAADNIEYAVKELETAKREIPAYSFEHEQRILDATVTTDWSGVLENLRDASWGYEQTKKAVIESRQSKNLAEVIEKLDSEHFIDNEKIDRKGLIDFRILAAAEAANRFEELGFEEQLTNIFIDRRPLLLYPSHAFELGFIDYQEKLKKKYQRIKKSGEGIFKIEKSTKKVWPNIQEVYMNLTQSYLRDIN